MISTFKRTPGFTLVELLVVMTIALTAVTLVSGLAIDSQQKFKVKAETLSLRGIFRKISNTAFILEASLDIVVKAERIQLLTEDESLIFEQRFEQLSFTPIRFNVNELGVFEKNSIQYFISGRSHQFLVSEGHNEN
jgi:prepilin-type N-terminal cleavage/methylation domain-containing protein